MGKRRIVRRGYLCEILFFFFVSGEKGVLGRYSVYCFIKLFKKNFICLFLELGCGEGFKVKCVFDIGEILFLAGEEDIVLIEI